ncbi:GntR family transcriptional regulator [Actinomyces vulturis]|uniref:GntR family transcriptional regulator n=1 Tax=Actinomyces vulturis TaxID=1857645 RepID=UPI0008337264|nr:GntR family transcriptional regulator [Actinomyces vulturis]
MSETPAVIDIDLDRSSPVPLYFQISEPIARAITSGTLAPGTRLEDELSMSRRLNISRPTARQALQRLVDRGLLTRRRGVGTIVAPAHVHRPMELTSLHSDLVKAGHSVTTVVINYSEHPASEEEAEHLEVATDTPIVSITRLRLTDDEPIALMHNLIPADIAPSREELESKGLYDLLREHHVSPNNARQTISARNATAKEAEILDDKRGVALLSAQRTSYDNTGRVIEYGDHIYRASRYTFETMLFSQ